MRRYPDHPVIRHNNNPIPTYLNHNTQLPAPLHNVVHLERKQRPHVKYTIATSATQHPAKTAPLTFKIQTAFASSLSSSIIPASQAPKDDQSLNVRNLVHATPPIVAGPSTSVTVENITRIARGHAVDWQNLSSGQPQSFDGEILIGMVKYPKHSQPFTSGE